MSTSATYKTLDHFFYVPRGNAFVLYIVKHSMDQEKHLDNLKKKMEERLTAEQEKSKRTKERHPENS